MSLTQDKIVVTKPERVVVGTDRSTDEVKRTIIIDSLVASWYVPEGEELVIPPWVEHHVRNSGWKLTRATAAHVVPELDSPVVGVRWGHIAEQMAEMLRRGEITEALDVYALAEMQQLAFEEHTHRFGTDPNPATKCLYPGCSMVFEDAPEPDEPPVSQGRLLPEWDDPE